MGLDFPVHTKYGSDGDLVSIWDIEVLEGFFPNKRGNIAGSGSDKDFSDVNVERPEILTPAQFRPLCRGQIIRLPILNRRNVHTQ